MAEEPLHSRSLAALAYARMQLGQLIEAMASYERSLAIAPSDPQVQFNYGTALAAPGDSLRDAPAFRETTRLDPSYYQAFGNLVFLLLARGDSLGARQAFERVLAIAPHDPLAK